MLLNFNANSVKQKKKKQTKAKSRHYVKTQTLLTMKDFSREKRNVLLVYTADQIES